MCLEKIFLNILEQRLKFANLIMPRHNRNEETLEKRYEKRDARLLMMIIKNAYGKLNKLQPIKTTRF